MSKGNAGERKNERKNELLEAWRLADEANDDKLARVEAKLVSLLEFLLEELDGD